MELNNADFCLFDTCGAARSNDNILVEYNTIDKLGVFDCAADLLHYSDITKINVGRGWCDKAHYCSYGDGSEGR